MASSVIEQTSSSSSPLPGSFPRWKYDVFLSFRGKDTRTNFTDHLYAALDRKGIITFKDDKELERGKDISQELLQAIQESRISVVIFSRNYASSPWCLDELVKIHECFTLGQHMVLPVFYRVPPSGVRNQTGKYGIDFINHTYNFRKNLDKVKRWRAAMTEVANLSGWDLQDRCESEFIGEIVDEIARKSSLKFSIFSKDLVGIDPLVEEISVDILTGMNDVRIIGICGMGGIGKTTIARVVFEQMSCEFEGSSFLANVRDAQQKHGLVSLQEQLLFEILMDRNIRIANVYRGINEIGNRLSRKRVLVVLDDIDNLEQLDSLVGMRNWYGVGSRIIITTRDEHLLACHCVDKTYRVQGLSHDAALLLFSLKAFKNDHPDHDYVGLSEKCVSYANGLPLALDILGKLLFGRSVDEWRSALDRLKDIPSTEILGKLQISFDGLEELEKKIFLDIACFFKGMKKEYVIKMLEYCGFHPNIGLRVLIDKSLITITNNTIWMHDLLQEMGQEIVRRESREEPGRRSRLWLYKDVHHILLNETGTEQVEGIFVDSCEQENEHLSSEAFLKMKQLRLLKLQGLHLSRDLEHLSNELRYLEWYGFPFKCLPPIFQPEKLVELHMRGSRIEQFWRETKSLPMLKIIDLSYSQHLIKTPDFGKLPNLEKINFEGCKRLFEVHKSIGVLKGLASLNLKDCKSLMELPHSICKLKSLRILILNGCSKLGKIPEELGNLSCLEELDLGGIAAKQFPATKLWDLLFHLWLFPRKNLRRALMLPFFSNLSLLKELSLREFNQTGGAIPDNLNCFPFLKRLNLSGNNFRHIPSSINNLSRLEFLLLENCRNLQLLPDLPLSITYLSMDGCSSVETILPTSIRPLSKLENLFLNNCKRLQSFPDLPSSIINLSMEGCTALDIFPIEGITHLHKLKSLCFDHCKRLQSLPNLPSNIKYLSMDGCTSLETLPHTSISQHNKLETLRFANCKKLLSFPDIPLSVNYLCLDGCTSLETCPSPFEKHHLRPLRLSFVNCMKLTEIQDAFSWLKCYLRLLGKGRHQGIHSHHHFSMCSPGNKVPDWFSYQATGCCLSVKPPPFWCGSAWMGFAFCVVFEAREPDSPSTFRLSEPPKVHSIFCKLYARFKVERSAITLDEHSFLGEWGTQISKDTAVSSDQLWFFFAPRNNSESMEWWNSCSSFAVSFLSDGFNVKYCGMRLVYEQDVGNLTTKISTLFNSLVVPCSNGGEPVERSNVVNQLRVARYNSICINVQALWWPIFRWAFRGFQ